MFYGNLFSITSDVQVSLQYPFTAKSVHACVTFNFSPVDRYFWDMHNFTLRPI